MEFLFTVEGRALRQAHLATRPTRTAGQLAQQIHPEGQLGLREKVPVEPGIEPGTTRLRMDNSTTHTVGAARRRAIYGFN